MYVQVVVSNIVVDKSRMHVLMLLVWLCRGTIGLCIKLAILVAVGCTVPAMYIFIRSTYFLGYKAR